MAEEKGLTHRKRCVSPFSGGNICAVDHQCVGVAVSDHTEDIG